MKVLIYLFSFLVITVFTKAQTFQNLVPNGSFENYTQCPNAGSQIYFAAPWTGPTTNNSDYNNACSTLMNVPHYGGVSHPYPFFLYAKDGFAYAGIHVYNLSNYMEYVQVSLTDTLKDKLCYYVEFYAALTQRAVFGVNNISAGFSAQSLPLNLSFPGTIPPMPNFITNYGNPILKDTVKWEKVSGIYSGTGTEKYIIIGNFKTHSNTDTSRIYQLGTGPVNLAYFSYYYIDAVSVFSINPNGNLPWSYRDTSIIKGDSVYIGNKMGGQNFNPKWYTLNGNYIATNAGIYVKPITTSSYVVQYTVCGTARADTVEVKVMPDVGFNELININDELKIYPNPAQNVLRLTVEDESLFKDFLRVSVYDKLGSLIREEDLMIKNKTAYLNTESLPDGAYYLSVKNKNSLIINKGFFVSH